LFIAFCGSSVTYNGWRIALHRHAYRRARFTVASVNYVHNEGDPVSYWTAHGRIVNAEEDMSLVGVIPTPRNQEDLERLVPVGTQFEVWYDKSAIPALMTQFVYLRVLPRKLYDFDNALAHAVCMTAIWDGLPFVTGCLIIGSFIRSRFIPRAES
jgi:hypothetical protein